MPARTRASTSVLFENGSLSRRMATMRILPLLPILPIAVLRIATLLAAPAGLAQAQSTAPRVSSLGEEQGGYVAQNSPCADQPRSLKEMTASYEKGRRPLASEMTGSWVEIGDIHDGPVDFPISLNCSGVTQQNKLEFVLIANGYSLELHAVGMAGPQTERMKPNDEGGVEFPEVYFGGEVYEEHHYRCRLTDRGTLVCLLGTSNGAEFKKMPVEKSRIFETEAPKGWAVNPVRN